MFEREFTQVPGKNIGMYTPQQMVRVNSEEVQTDDGSKMNFRVAASEIRRYTTLYNQTLFNEEPERRPDLKLVDEPHPTDWVGFDIHQPLEDPKFHTLEQIEKAYSYRLPSELVVKAVQVDPANPESPFFVFIGNRTIVEARKRENEINPYNIAGEANSLKDQVLFTPKIANFNLIGQERFLVERGRVTFPTIIPRLGFDPNKLILGIIAADRKSHLAIVYYPHIKEQGLTGVTELVMTISDAERLLTNLCKTQNIPEKTMLDVLDHYLIGLTRFGDSWEAHAHDGAGKILQKMMDRRKET